MRSSFKILYFLSLTKTIPCNIGLDVQTLINMCHLWAQVLASELRNRFPQSTVLRVCCLSSFSLFSKKICLLAVTNSHVQKIKNTTPSIVVILYKITVCHVITICHNVAITTGSAGQQFVMGTQVCLVATSIAHFSKSYNYCT